MIQSLKNKSSSKANYVFQKFPSRLNDYWIYLRLREAEIPAAQILRSIPSQNINSLFQNLDDPLDVYLRIKGEHRKGHSL
jgi:hypothetical protein